MKDEEFRKRVVEALDRIASVLDQKKPQAGKRELTEKELEQRRKAIAARYGARTEPVASPKKKVAVSTQRNPGQKTAALVATYCEAFKARYHTNPHITRKTAGQAAQLLQSMPLERGQELVQAFLQMEEPWFLTRTHDFGVLLMNLNAVAVALANGTKSPQEKSFWSNVFKEVQSDEGNLSAPHQQDAGQLGSSPLPGAHRGAPLASLPKRR